VLGGCATTTSDCEPKGGIGSGLIGFFSDCNERRLEEKKKVLEEEKKRKDKIITQQTQLKTKKEELRAQFKELSDETDKLAARVFTLTLGALGLPPKINLGLQN